MPEELKNEKDTVYFFTNELNVSFVQEEIMNLSLHFKEVNVHAFDTNGAPVFPLNVKVKKADFSGYSTSGALFSNPFSFLFLSLGELLSCPRYLLYFPIYLKTLSGLLRCSYLAERLKKEVARPDAVFYSFWFNQWATVLSLLVKNKIIAGYSTRTHGTDLYEFRVPKTKHIPFRWFQLKRVLEVFSVSKKGEAYLKQKYPAHTKKIHSSYLGSRDSGPGCFDAQSIFTIVSCANVRNIKRIHLIPEILENLDVPVKWIHIGSENPDSSDRTLALYKRNKEKLALKKNIAAEFKGKMSNAEVMRFYKENSINLFVSVSETEGLPVSMMEAISFGIPVLSTDVGGCSEIVNDATGILIPADFEPKTVAAVIEHFMGSEKNTQVFRNKVREFWQENFNVEVNFNNFLSRI